MRYADDDLPYLDLEFDPNLERNPPPELGPWDGKRKLILAPGVSIAGTASSTRRLAAAAPEKGPPLPHGSLAGPSSFRRSGANLHSAHAEPARTCTQTQYQAERRAASARRTP